MPVKNFPATVEEIAFIYFFDWHYTERSYGKDMGKGGTCARDGRKKMIGLYLYGPFSEPGHLLDERSQVDLIKGNGWVEYAEPIGAERRNIGSCCFCAECQAQVSA
jgi:hypothetical protein